MDAPSDPVYRLGPSIALRREPFGAIAYSYETRRLQMVRSRLAVEVAVRLDEGESVTDVVAWLARGDEQRRGPAETQVAAAIDGLVAAGVLVAVPANGRAP